MGLGWSRSVLEEGALRGGCVMAERACPRGPASPLFCGFSSQFWVPQIRSFTLAGC